ncbi:TniQ family protein [Amycolatopsis anabasis]|uniref:TniQ family protein n=1 Tax=Amycolatopsis anabasis TaxID=1840409 RepID=UPI002483ABB6|nr:TniQ family protein [Amycolatopsis anabasis]
MNWPRALPIRLAPLPSEPLDSWLEAYAHRCGVDYGQMLMAVGLHSYRQQVADHTVYLHHEEAEHIAQITGLSVQRLHAMTLRRYDGHALVLNDTRRSVSRMQLWGRGRGSRFCPQCLEERGGRWMLRWRLSWTFACTRHHLLLPHSCPQCQKRTRYGKITVHRDTPPHLCPTPMAKRGHPCRTDLTTALALQIDLGSPMLDTQAWIDQLLDRVEAGDTRPDPTPRVVLNDLRSLASWILRRARPGDFLFLGEEIDQELHTSQDDGAFAPVSAAVTAAALSRAARLLQQPEHDSTIDFVRTLIDRDIDQVDLINPADVRKRWSNCSTGVQQLIWRAMDTRLGTVDRLRYRSCTSTPQPPPADRHVTARARHIPQLLWPGWTVRFLPPTGFRSTEKFRAAMAVALLLPGFNRRQFAPLIKMLHTEREPDVHYTCAKLIRHGGDGPLAALCQIASYLDKHGSLIDYARRREVIGADLLPEADWLDICVSTTTHPGTQTRLLMMRRYLYQRLTGNELRHAPAPLRLTSAQHLAAFAQIPFTLTAPLLTALDQYARTYLAAKGIDEPVTWEPPTDHIDKLTLPGREPDDIDISTAQHLVCVRRMKPTEVAVKLGTTLEHVRVAFEQHPLPVARPSRRAAHRARPQTAPMPRRLKPAPRTKLAAAQARHRAAHLLTVDFLREHHVTQRKPIRQIAAENDLPRPLVAGYLHQFDLIQHAADRAHPVDAAWLREQYLHRGRPLSDLAEELGISVTRLNARAKQLGIPLRPRGAASTAAVTLTAPDNLPPILQRAVHGTSSWSRLRRFQAAMRFRTISEAATALGLRQPVLSSQIARIECDLGTPLHTRPRKGEALQLTDLGRALLDALDALPIRDPVLESVTARKSPDQRPSLEGPPQPGELTNTAWGRIEPRLPTSSTGRPPQHRRMIINGILWKLRTGTGWRRVPARYGNGATLHSYYRQWTANGVWQGLQPFIDTVPTKTASELP